MLRCNYAMSPSKAGVQVGRGAGGSRRRCLLPCTVWGKFQGSLSLLLPRSLPSTSSVFARGLTPAPNNCSNTCSAPSGPTKQLGFHQNKSSPQNLSGGRLKGASVTTKASNHGARAVEYKCNPTKGPLAGRPSMEASLEAEATFSTVKMVVLHLNGP